MNLKAFEQLLNSYGCRIEATTNHHRIVKDGENIVPAIAIDHKRKQVKPYVVARFLAAVKELGLTKK